MNENYADNLSNNVRLNEISYLYFSNFTAKKKKPIRNSCRSLWPTLILILLNIELKIFRKRPGDESFEFHSNS